MFEDRKDIIFNLPAPVAQPAPIKESDEPELIVNETQKKFEVFVDKFFVGIKARPDLERKGFEMTHEQR